MDVVSVGLTSAVSGAELAGFSLLSNPISAARMRVNHCPKSHVRDKNGCSNHLTHLKGLGTELICNTDQIYSVMIDIVYQNVEGK